MPDAPPDDCWRPHTTLELEHGDLKALFRDNSQSPRILSGVDRRTNRHAAAFDAFDPDFPGASAGLNFEHIICGHANFENRFAPRKYKYALYGCAGRPVARLVRLEHDDPWRVSSTLTY